MKRKEKLKFTRDNLLKGKVPNRPGLYRFYDKNGKLLYVGHAKKLRHRVQSYWQQDDFREHPTKKPLRRKIDKYSYTRMPKERAKEVEKKMKKRAKYNFL